MGSRPTRGRADGPGVKTLAWCPLLLLAACDPFGAPANDGVPRVDGRTDASFEASMRAIKRGIPNAEQGLLTDSILRLHAPVAARVLRSSGGDPEALRRSLRETIHGMSVAEIHAAAARLK